MKRQTLFFGIFATTILTVPAFAAGDNAGITGVHWGRNAFGYEPLPSGPQPVTNLKRRPDGTSNGAQLVGDYNNPILKPAAGAVVKQKGELAIAGKGFPNLSDQCRLYAPPFTFAMQLGFQILQRNDGDITIIYNQDDNVRHIHMNATHPTNLVPSPMGDAVGHWEGETLVIDTVGIKTNAFSAADIRNAAERGNACDRTLPTDRRSSRQGRAGQLREGSGRRRPAHRPRYACQGITA
jgi:hypothetical protein